MAGRKANFQWTRGSQTWSIVLSSADSLASLATANDPATIRRMIVDFYVAFTANVDNQQAQGACGIIVADATVIAAGVSAIPKPDTQGDQEWLWNRSYALKMDGTATGLMYTPLHLHDDMRAMRKVKQNDVVALVVENFTGASVQVAASARILFST